MAERILTTLEDLIEQGFQLITLEGNKVRIVHPIHGPIGDVTTISAQELWEGLQRNRADTPGAAAYLAVKVGDKKIIV